jgi:hypothetical protein
VYIFFETPGISYSFYIYISFIVTILEYLGIWKIKIFLFEVSYFKIPIAIIITAFESVILIFRTLIFITMDETECTENTPQKDLKLISRPYFKNNLLVLYEYVKYILSGIHNKRHDQGVHICILYLGLRFNYTDKI